MFSESIALRKGFSSYNIFSFADTGWRVTQSVEVINNATSWKDKFKVRLGPEKFKLRLG